ncbi:MAG: hypothetical protein ACXVW1_08780 [Nocardioides sp.]
MSFHTRSSRAGSSRHRRPSRLLRTHRSKTVLGVAVAVTAALVGYSSPALAVHELTMQLDGNTKVDATGPTYDWESFFQADATTGDVAPKAAALPAGFLARGQIADYALPEHTTFATGSKDTLNIGPITSPKKLAAGWQCGNSNNLGAKDDLVNVYTVAYRNPANQHLILYFGAEKSSNLGDNNIGIWFLQDSTVGCTVPASGRNTDFTGHHVPGDVLLTAAFTNGGTQASVEARTWVASSDNGGEGTVSAADTGFLCGSSSNDKACAITNLADFDPPWNHPVKTPGANGTALAPQEFYEGGVDVTQLQIDAGNTGDPCITTFLADTRSSQSDTATLFDFATASFPVCKPATTLTIERSPATIHSGDSVTWTAHEANTGTSPISNVTVTDAATTGACSPFTYVSGDTNNNGKLDPATQSAAAETWDFTCTQTLTASRTINVYGSGTDTISGKTIAGGPASKCTFSTTSPPTVTFQADGYVCDPNERASASVTVIHPSTSLTTTAATVSPSTAHANDPVLFTFYETNDGDTALTSPSVTTDDANCATATYSSGDTNTNGVLDIGETWAFTCSTSFSSTGSQTVTATGHGTDPLGADVTSYGSPLCTSGTVSNGKLCDLDEVTSKSVTIINPGTILRETASAVVTFVYNENNAGDSVITNPYVTSDCAGAGAHVSSVLGADGVHNVGDTGNDGVFSSGETWRFTCTKTVSIPAGSNTVTFTDNGAGHGTDAAGGTVDSTTDTREADSSTVTVTNNAPN